MRIFHTSDWHIGRTFHGYPTLDAVRGVLAAIPDVVRAHGVDVVLVAGDVYDIANPSAEAVGVFKDSMTAILATGAKVVMTNGNHDSAPRLGVIGAFSAAAGLHLLTDAAAVGTPVHLDGSLGDVDFYGIPYLQPELVRHLPWVPAGAQTQHQVIAAAMDVIRASARQRPGRTAVVLAHTFVAGAGEEPFLERAIAKGPLVAGGIDAVPVGVFDGVGYVALGHIHGRAELAGHVRYPGAVLHYSFAEAGKPRGGWLVDISPDGVEHAEWVDLPIPRPLTEITGRLGDLLTDARWDAFADHYIRAVYTDNSRQTDPMQRLRARFPYCAEVVHEPAERATQPAATYRERVKGKSDAQVVESFLIDVRNGEGATPAEQGIVDDVIAEYGAQGMFR